MLLKQDRRWFSHLAPALLCVLPATACPAAPAGGQDWEQEAKLLAADGHGYDEFGSSVALSGVVALIGANGDSDNGTSAGSAYVFRYEAPDWVEEDELLVSDGAPGDHLGMCVSIGGDVALVGAPAINMLEAPGSAYVFRRNGSSWFEEAKLMAADGAGQDWFGSTVSISGDAVIVGARNDDDTGLDSGSAYVFRYDGSAWTEEVKLLASDGGANAKFGASVSLVGHVAVVGATGDDDNGPDSGSAYIFRFNGADWIQEAKLLPSDGAEGDRFGVSAAIRGDVALIGAPFDDDNGLASGSAYVFRFDGSSWAEEVKLLPSDRAPYDLFGRSVSVFDDVAVIGVYGDDDNGTTSGSAYVFRYRGAGWVEMAKLLASDGAHADCFGYSVSVSGATALIGAYHDDDNGTKSGSAYVFRLANPDCPADFDDDRDVDRFDLLHLLGAWGTPNGDVDGDGDTDTSDLLALLGAWGECP